MADTPFHIQGGEVTQAADPNMIDRYRYTFGIDEVCPVT